MERAVHRLEQRTDAEVVVVAAERSGTYRDASLIVGLVGGLVMLLVVLFIDWPVHPTMVPVDVALGVMVAYGLARLRPVLRLLIPQRRRRTTVVQAARAAFVTEAVHATPQRSGVLVYVSALEGMVVFVRDVGVEAVIPKAEWRAAVRDVHATDLDGFLAGLDRLGEVLARHLPPTDGPDRVALSDAPRVHT